MRQGTTDLMIEFAVACLATENHQDIRKLVREMAQAWPNEPALGVAFAITSASSLLEDILNTSSAHNAAQFGYRMAALVAADIYAIEAMGQIPAKGQDLLHFWRRTDRYFLDA